MHEFSELVSHIWDLLMRAQDLIREAIENKHDKPDLAAAYYRVAGNIMTDVDLLTKQAESCVDKAEAENSEDFEDMDVLWSADKGRLIDRTGHVKIFMDMYR